MTKTTAQGDAVPPAAPGSRVLPALRRGIHLTAWYVKGVLGEDAYEKYRTHWESVHGDGDTDNGPTPDRAPGGEARMMTEREFWRDRSDRQDTNPGARCC